MGFDNIVIEKSRVLDDVVLIKPSVYWDIRGNIYTSYLNSCFKSILPEGVAFVHDKFAENKRNVLRGLHGDSKTWKLVSCVWGKIYEVVVDMRKNSDTYLKWESFELNSDDYSQVLIPPGFVNGYYVQSENAVFHYKLAYDGNYNDAPEQMTIKWDSKNLNIKWPCTDPVLQERDK